MFNPLGAGFRWAVEMPNTRPGDSIVILGPGQRGLACVVACREVGAGTIIVTGIAADANKLALARKFGADHTIDVDNEDPVARVKELTNGRGVDIVVDVSSYATKPVTDALSMVRPGGTVVLAGVKGFRAVDNFVSDLRRHEGDQHQRRNRRDIVGLQGRDPSDRIAGACRSN